VSARGLLSSLENKKAGNVAPGILPRYDLPGLNDYVVRRGAFAGGSILQLRFYLTQLAVDAFMAPVHRFMPLRKSRWDVKDKQDEFFQSKP